SDSERPDLGVAGFGIDAANLRHAGRRNANVKGRSERDEEPAILVDRDILPAMRGVGRHIVIHDFARAEIVEVRFGVLVFDQLVGGPEGGARPFWASVSSPRNQSSGGWVQNSLVPDSYLWRPCCCALAWLAPATTKIAASATIDRFKADFIASLPMQPRGCP